MTEEDGTKKKRENKQVCGNTSNPIYLTDRQRDARIDSKAKEERENEAEQGRICANIT